MIAPRSLCRVCKRQLGFSELIPVLSYLMQRGGAKGVKLRYRSCIRQLSSPPPSCLRLPACTFGIMGSW
ncbi:prepilin peptidase [Bacillus licheniformis]